MSCLDITNPGAVHLWAVTRPHVHLSSKRAPSVATDDRFERRTILSDGPGGRRVEWVVSAIIVNVTKTGPSSPARCYATLYPASFQAPIPPLRFINGPTPARSSSERAVEERSPWPQ